MFNGQTKKQAGPHWLGFSNDIEKVNTWINTSHIHAKTREIFNAKTKLATTSLHKENTPSAKLLHREHVQSSTNKLYEYNYDPFSVGPAKQICTGKEISSDIINETCSMQIC